MNNMYEKIENLCKEKGVSITGLSKDTGIPRSTFSELKAGRTKQLSGKHLPVVAEYLNVSVDYLLGNEQKEKPLVNQDQELTEYLEELKNREDLRMLFSLAKGATKEDVMQAVKIIEALRDK